MKRTSKKVLSFVMVVALCLGLAVQAVAHEPGMSGFQQAVPVIIPELQIPIEYYSGTRVWYGDGWTETTHITSIHNEDFTVTVTNAFDRVGAWRKGAGSMTIFTDRNGTVRFDIDVEVYLIYTDDWSTYRRAIISAGEILTLSDFFQVTLPIQVHIYDEDFDFEDVATLEFRVHEEPEHLYRYDHFVDTISDVFTFFRFSVEPPSSWAVEQIDTARDAGLASWWGLHYPQPVTRAEFTALAVRLYETITDSEIVGRVTFIDTSYVHVRKAAYIGVVTGVGDNRFDPHAQLTREQAAVMLARLADAIGQPLPQVAATFADNTDISSWAVDAVGQVQAAGIMQGADGNRFNPQGLFTREQSIVTILRIFDAFS